MGKFNSSTYRVRPLMECVEKDYDALLAVLSLVGLSHLGQPIIYRYDGISCSEMKLKPQKNICLRF